MSQPEIPQKGPYAVDVVAGTSYWWCTCGKSKAQPFCDGSHMGTNFQPLEFIASKDETAWFCGCKHTCEKPMCDGTHSTI